MLQHASNHERQQTVSTACQYSNCKFSSDYSTSFRFRLNMYNRPTHISKFTICCAYHSVLVLIFLYYIQITFNTVCVTSTVSNTCILTSTMASPSAVDTGDDAATCVVYNTCDGHDDKGSWYIITLNINYRLCQATSITSSHLNPKN